MERAEKKLGELELKKARVEYAVALHLSKRGCNAGIRKHNGDKAQWLSTLIYFADKVIKAQRPHFEGDGYDDSGNFIYDTWICPSCGERYEVDYDIYNYCPNCGQKIDWSDTE